MERIVDLHLAFLKQVKNDQKVMHQLKKSGIQILSGFEDNIELVRQFYRKWYDSEPNTKIVLCGINPGKKGAGKTGVPFVDYRGISQLIEGVYDDDWEQSAQFIYSIIEEIGAKTFFNHVYLTNVSWFGFQSKGKNVNYHELPRDLQHKFTETFIKEMNIIQPKVIIPVSKEVHKTLIQMQKDKRLKTSIGPRLNHPYHCSIKTNFQKGKEEYLQTIYKHLNETQVG